MASKKILLLVDSDRYSSPLISFLASNAKVFGWKLRMGALFDAEILERTKAEPASEKVEFADFRKIQECEQAIKKSDLVIAMAQDPLLLQIADSCINYRKPLISPARLTRQMATKRPLAKENNVLVLMDCGFSPGLDHIIAKKAIDNIHSKGGSISSFKTYSGIVLSETSDANPWHYKVTEPVGDLFSWGKHTNRHLLNGKMQHVPCHRLFERAEPIAVREQDGIVAIPEGDSLYYKKIYNLDDAHTVVKGKLVRQGFQQVWNVLVRLGLTDAASRMDLASHGSYYNAIESLLPASLPGSTEERLKQYAGAHDSDIEKMKWLGLFDTTPWTDPNRELTPSQILQTLLQQKLMMEDGDSDCAVMEHQIGYEFRDEHAEMTASLIVKGDGDRESALAKVIGFTCGAAAKSVLLGSIKVKGLHIPILREIYDPILNELEELGIAFHMTEKKRIAPEGVTATDNG